MPTQLKQLLIMLVQPVIISAYSAKAAADYACTANYNQCLLS